MSISKLEYWDRHHEDPDQPEFALSRRCHNGDHEDCSGLSCDCECHEDDPYADEKLAPDEPDETLAEPSAAERAKPAAGVRISERSERNQNG